MSIPLRIFIACLLGILSPLLYGQSSEIYYPDTRVYVHAYSGLNMRSGPSGADAKISKLRYGTRIKILECAWKFAEVKDFGGYTIGDYWYKVEYQGQMGYVFGGYVSRFPPVENTHLILQTYLQESFAVVDTLVLETWKELPCHFLVTYDAGVVYTQSRCDHECGSERYIWEDTQLAEVAAILKAVLDNGDEQCGMRYVPEEDFLFFEQELCEYRLRSLSTGGVLLEIECNC